LLSKLVSAFSDRVEANCGPAAEVVPLAFDDADAKQQNVNGISELQKTIRPTGRG